MAEAIVSHFRGFVGQGHPISEVVLVPSGQGIFDVEADGQLIFSKFVTKRHAEHGEVIESIRKLLG